MELRNAHQIKMGAVEAILAVCPKFFAEGPLAVEVIDKSLEYIEREDQQIPKSLFLHSLHEISRQCALSSKDFKKQLQGKYMECFANGPWIGNPDIMMTVLDTCRWSNYRKAAKIHVTSNRFNFKVNGMTYISIDFPDNDYWTPEWLPYLLRNLCADRTETIDVEFEGGPNDVDDLTEYCRDMLRQVRTVNLSKRNNIKNRPRYVYWGYTMIRGTVCFSPHSNRRAGATVFAKLSVCSYQYRRNVNQMMKADIKQSSR